MMVYGSHDDRTLQQLGRCVDAEPGALGVLCADGHVGYSMPIGGVVAYREHLSPSGVGYDIACGNMAVQTNIMAKDITAEERVRLADEIQRRISFGIGRKNNEPIDSPVFDLIAHAQVKEQRHLIQMAQNQLGTVGSGNHYVDVLEDEAGVVWVACHFGSRGFGHKTATGFLRLANGGTFHEGKSEGEMDSPPVLIPQNSPLGCDYWAAMHLAGQYAYAGREAVIQKTLDIIGAEAEFTVHNHHNFTWREEHLGETFLVVRKGATPAAPGQLGFVGGSMGDMSVILRGKESQQAQDTLYSTVHGAGRVMSRTQAAGKMKWTKGKWSCRNYRNCQFSAPLPTFQRGKGGELPPCPLCGSKLQAEKGSKTRVGEGLINFTLVKADLVARGIVLRGANAEEAPGAYRPLQSVLDAHRNSVDVVHTLQPMIVVMAGEDEHDPYKD